MKFASVSWAWTPIPEDTPHGDSLIKITDRIKDAGFDAIDYLATTEGLDEFFDESASRELGEHAREIGLEPNVFVFQSADWNNPDVKVRESNMRYFEKCAQTAKWVGCGIISSLSPKPAGTKGWLINPRAHAEKQSFRLGKDYNFKEDWKRLADGYKAALEVAKQFGLRLSIECFPMSMVSTPHAMLQLLEDVNDNDFGIQFDTNHLIAQRIDPEWAINMVGGSNIFNVHCKDHDGVSRGNIPAGTGIVDYPVIIETLKNVGYKGNLTVELEFTNNPRRYNMQALEHLKHCTAGEY